VWNSANTVHIGNDELLSEVNWATMLPLALSLLQLQLQQLRDVHKPSVIWVNNN